MYRALLLNSAKAAQATICNVRTQNYYKQGTSPNSMSGEDLKEESITSQAIIGDRTRAAVSSHIIVQQCKA
jgi:S-adenosylmethionine/arginine decarboxylase-like enzyme